MIALGNNTWEAPYGRDIPLGEAAGLTVFDGSGFAETVVTPQTAVRGARVLTDAAIGDGDTITIHRVDTSTQVYTWKTTLTPTIGEVLIGASNTTALTNMASAISAGGTPGTDYATGTEPCLDYDVASDGTTLTLTAVNFGDYANTAIGNFAETGGSASWASATSGVDSVDFVQYQDNSGTAISDAAGVSAQPVMRGAEFKIAPTAAQLTAKVYSGAIFDESEDSSGDDTATSVWLRRAYTIITTDHPAAGKTNGALYAGVLDDPTDLAASGATVEIPNSAHGDFGDWLGGDFSVPDTDNVIQSNWMVIFNPYSGERAVAEIKTYDFDGGGGADQGLITFVVGGPMRIPSVLRTAGRLWYLIYESNVGLSPELGAQAKLDVHAGAAMVEDYAADGAAATSAQIQYMILALLSEFAVVSTTLTAKKLDGSTTAATFTLSDATNPTSVTRTT